MDLLSKIVPFVVLSIERAVSINILSNKHDKSLSRKRSFLAKPSKSFLVSTAREHRHLFAECSADFLSVLRHL